MKRRYRLRARERFQQVRTEGRCWADRLLVLCILPNGLAWSRFGFSTSKRVGKAVVRNRVRRRLREVVSLRREHIDAGWDVVFIARPPSAHASYPQIEQSCEGLLARAGLLDSTP